MYNSIKTTIVYIPLNVQFHKIFYTNLGTRRCPGYLTHSRRLPRIWSILPGNNIFALKVDPLSFESKTRLRTFPWFSRVLQSKFKANRSRCSWVVIGQTGRQSETTTLYIYDSIKWPNSIKYTIFQKIYRIGWFYGISYI